MKIMIVSGHNEILWQLAALCQEAGAGQVKTFAQPAAGIIHLINESPDVVFLDLDGLDLDEPEAASLQDYGYERGITLVLVAASEAHALRAVGLKAEGYLLKPIVAAETLTLLARLRARLQPSRAEIRTFGHFDVFVDGQPLYFKNAKAKELLALLVDKRGTVTMEMAITVLWDNRSYDDRVKQLYRKAVSFLQKLFTGRELDIFASNRGSCFIKPENFACDYYDLLKGRKEAIAAFNGEYMFEYAWAELTLVQIENLIESYTGKICNY
jgi:two-component SAPR family response regulator